MRIVNWGKNMLKKMVNPTCLHFQLAKAVSWLASLSTSTLSCICESHILNIEIRTISDYLIKS